MPGYYYRQLNKAQKEAYEAMRSGMDAVQSSFRVPRLPDAEMVEVFTRLKLDEPLLFYAVHFSYRFHPEAGHVEFLPEYLFDKAKIKEHRQAIAARLERLARPLRQLPAAQRQQAIHDFILDNVRYDKLKKPYSHEIIGPLTQGVGVCEGIAKTVKALCDAVGIECIVALSENNPAKGIKYRHTWNIITIDGRRYHMDATFDNSLQCGLRRYDYYNLDDRHIFIDHEPPVYPLPVCSDEKSYFYRSISLTKPEDVENRFSQALRKRQEHFVFHWRGGGLNRAILNDLLVRCDALAKQRDRSISCSVNLAQAVIQIDIGNASRGVLVQQPDEGQTE